MILMILRSRCFFYIACCLCFLFFISGLYRYSKTTPLMPNFYWGDTESLHDFIGKPVLLYFWSPQCSSCLREWPNLVALYEEYHAQGLVLIGIAVQKSSEEDLQTWIRRNDPAFPIIFDKKGVIAENYYKTSLTPTFFLLDRKHFLSWYKLGIPLLSVLKGKIEVVLSR